MLLDIIETVALLGAEISVVSVVIYYVAKKAVRDVLREETRSKSL